MKKKNIDEKVSEMMFTPMNQLPTLAFEYMRWMSSRVGFCGEVCVTAYYHYCQAVLKMRTKNLSYKIDATGKEWFKNPQIVEIKKKGKR